VNKRITGSLSDFRPEVEIWSLCLDAVKNDQKITWHRAVSLRLARLVLP